MRRISRGNLQNKLDVERPNNTDPQEGYALVAVLKREDFLDLHIPGSTNIPEGMESEFRRRFNKSKEIIVYCGSAECPASTNVANELVQRGFTNISVYEGGISEWSESGSQLERGDAAIRELYV